MAIQSVDYECTWCMLFWKEYVFTKLYIYIFVLTKGNKNWIILSWVYVIRKMAHFVAGYGMVSSQSEQAADSFTRNFATWMLSSSCTSECRQEQDVPGQDDIVAVERLVMPVLIHDQQSSIEDEMLSRSKEPVSTQGMKKMKADNWNNEGNKV